MVMMMQRQSDVEKFAYPLQETKTVLTNALALIFQCENNICRKYVFALVSFSLHRTL